MWPLILKVVEWIFRRRQEPADAVYSGFSDLLERWQQFIEPLERRIDECEADRNRLRRVVKQLYRRIRVLEKYNEQ